MINVAPKYIHGATESTAGDDSKEGAKAGHPQQASENRSADAAGSGQREGAEGNNAGEGGSFHPRIAGKNKFAVFLQFSKFFTDQR